MDTTYDVQVDIFQDSAGAFHYQVYRPGVPNGRKGPTMCGLDIADLRSVAWFAVGDQRGRVHYDKACDTCRSLMVY